MKRPIIALASILATAYLMGRHTVGGTTESLVTDVNTYDMTPCVTMSEQDTALKPIACITPVVEVVEVTEVTEVTETVVIAETPVIAEDGEYYDIPLDYALQDYISELCETNGVPMSLIIAMIEVESTFTANVISRTNDWGLMQINKINHEWMSEMYGITDFLDPYQNVFCGITLVSQYYKRYKNESKTLMAYNLGANGAKRLWNEGIYETSYSRKILSAKEEYEDEVK